MCDLESLVFTRAFQFVKMNGNDGRDFKSRFFELNGSFLEIIVFVLNKRSKEQFLENVIFFFLFHLCGSRVEINTLNMIPY